MPRIAKLPIESINIQLVKSEITDINLAIAKDKKPEKIEARTAILPGATLYFQAPPPGGVSWQNFLRPAFGAGVDRFRSQHASAVLFYPAGGRMFAATFGYGRSLLSESALVSDFGLRTALNLCDPRTLRTVDYRTIEERTRIGRIQLSEEGSVDAFRVDTATDLLRGIEAKSNDASLCERVGARWSSLIVSARVEAGTLPALSAKLLKLYQKKKLPPEFAWIDNVKRVTDPSRVSKLEDALEARLDGNKHRGIRLAVPEIFGSTVGIEAKLFKPTGVDFDSDVQVYLDNRPRETDSTLHAAKRNHDVVLVETATAKVKASISVYRCLVAEIEEQSDLFLLTDGEWFQLNRDFVAEVEKAVSEIRISKHQWPAWKAGEAEGSWNERACASGKHSALLDKANIVQKGRHSAIEPADMLTTDRVFAHVKRRDKNSSGLSHLFAQGTVAAELISQDRPFRRLVAEKLPPSHATLTKLLKANTFDPRDWTIAYVILGADSKSPAAGLPFFSKVNLRRSVERLNSMQYKVGIVGI